MERENMNEIMMTGDEMEISYLKDVTYETIDNCNLHLQLLIPHISNHPDALFPGICYIQGSAWKKQNVYKDIVNLGKLAARGYVIGIAQYRSSEIAHFPAQIIDAKNALRFMKAHSKDYHINKNEMILMGNSSGGQVATIAGMTSHTSLFDEPVNEQDCQVKAIIDEYGAVEITLDGGFPSTTDYQLPTSPEGLLMEYNIRENKEKAQIANSKTYVKEDFAPMLIIHGTEDKTVSMQESINLYDALKKANKEVELYLIKGADHGGPAFFKDEVINIIDHFIKKWI